jgi:hypothetical protein
LCRFNPAGDIVGQADVKIYYCDSEERKPVKLLASGQKFGCGGEI